MKKRFSNKKHQSLFQKTQGIFLRTCLRKKFISFESLVIRVRQAETALDRIYKDQLSDGATIN